MQNFDLKKFERERLVRKASLALSAVPRTIVSAVNPRSPGSVHDFSSEADYWWPDPANPDGPYVQRDGLSNPANFTIHRELMLDFAETVGTLAAACIVTEDKQYADAALTQLRAWFVDPATRMNPNLQYAQAIKGICTGRGIGVIDTVHLAEVALAAKALHQIGMFSSEEVAPVASWFAAYLEWLCTHPYGIEESNWPNNHGTCWALQASAFARFTGNANVISDCRRRLTEVLLPGQMAADGSFPQELARTKPYGYSLFNLDVMTSLARVLSTPTDNLLRYSLPDGRSIIRGVEFLAPFLADKSSWPHRQDVMYWDEWPVQQPSLLFGAMAANRNDWLEVWKRLDPDPVVLEVRRNYPIRNAVIWLEASQ
ncbi:MAG: Alginate lyase [Rhodocyclales bacterium]|nr:Alginate lyase [Rhodocyclales bacterium]